MIVSILMLFYMENLKDFVTRFFFQREQKMLETTTTKRRRTKKKKKTIRTLWVESIPLCKKIQKRHNRIKMIQQKESLSKRERFNKRHPRMAKELRDLERGCTWERW